jgi:hypothetical protein
LLLIESLKVSRRAASMLAWGVVGVVLVVMMWVDCMAAFAGIAVAWGVPWITVAVAVTAIQILAAILIMRVGIRIGRNLRLSAANRSQARASEAA